MKKNILLLLFFVSLLFAISCQKQSERKYVANYLIFDSVIVEYDHNSHTYTYDYKISDSVSISLDSNIHQLTYNNAKYNLESGSANTYGSFPSNEITLTYDSISIFNSDQGVIGFTTLKLTGYRN